MTEIVVHACPPRCDAGGTEFDGGHVFDLEVELRDADGNVNGWSVACRCGLTHFDWTLMRPAPPRNEVLITCPHCDYDEAEGGLVDQCDACKRNNAEQKSLMVRGEWHDVRLLVNGAVVDGCDAGCNGTTYLRRNRDCIQTVNIFGLPLPKALWKCDEKSMHFERHAARIGVCAKSDVNRRMCEHHEALYGEDATNA